MGRQRPAAERLPSQRAPLSEVVEKQVAESSSKGRRFEPVAWLKLIFFKTRRVARAHPALSDFILLVLVSFLYVVRATAARASPTRQALYAPDAPKRCAAPLLFHVFRTGHSPRSCVKREAGKVGLVCALLSSATTLRLSGSQSY